MQDEKTIPSKTFLQLRKEEDKNMSACEQPLSLDCTVNDYS